MSDNFDDMFEGDLDLKSRNEFKKPNMYRVILHNDHYTTMDFVVTILTGIFHMEEPKAAKIMMDVHKKGAGECGMYTYDVAVTKVKQVHEMAEVNEFPLKCSHEKA